MLELRRVLNEYKYKSSQVREVNFVINFNLANIIRISDITKSHIENGIGHTKVDYALVLHYFVILTKIVILYNAG